MKKMSLYIYVIFFIFFCFFKTAQIFSMEDNNYAQEIRNRKFNVNKTELQQIIVGNFEDHKLVGENSFKYILPGKIFPTEIWLEIISYLDFNDPALIYFFAPRIGVSTKQAEKIAIAIHNFAIKNANKLEDLDFKLKSILKNYSRQSQELLYKNLNIINNDFNIKKIKLSSSLGRFPIKWLLRCPEEMDNELNDFKKECGNIHKKIKSKTQSYKDFEKAYLKIKKVKLLYESFNFHKYKKILAWIENHKAISAFLILGLCYLGWYCLLGGGKYIILGLSFFAFGVAQAYYFVDVIDCHKSLVHMFRRFLYEFDIVEDLMKF